jgi:hypothetical protein
MIDVDDLPAGHRVLLADLWQSRAKSEATVRVVFDQLVGELSQANAHAAVIDLARHAAEDEDRHARICHDLATAYRGRPIELVATPTARLPDYTTDMRLRAALHAINLCCVSESLACAFVEACMATCDDSELRAIHGRHLADEIGHARIGWAHIASLSPEDKAAVAPFLVDILRAQVEGWESRVHALPEHGVPGHGYPARDAIIDVIHGAVREIILPGFAHVGIDATAAQTWFDAHVD